MELKSGRRRMVSFGDLKQFLKEEPDYWVAFQCIVDVTGNREWRVLVLKDGEDPIFVTTAKGREKRFSLPETVISFFVETYPDKTHLPLPVHDGEYGPRSHPLQNKA